MEVQTAAIAHNARVLADLARPARLMAVVKADGYGHGAVAVARAALAGGAAYLGVATAEEAVALRRAGIRAPILVFGVGGAAEPLERFVHEDLTATITTLQAARRLSEAARAAGRVVRVHVKVDTGMGRLGVLPQQAPALVREICSLPGLRLEGLYTHLATADEPDAGYMLRQAATFRQVWEALEASGVRVSVRHMLNTAGLLARPELGLEMVRCGIGLYGYYPAPHLRSRAELRPALRLWATVAEARRLPAGSSISYGRTYTTPRPANVVTLSVGYADGFSRLLSGRARAVIRGRAYPIVGRICMDQCMAEVGDDPVSAGEPALLLGPGGDGEMTVDEAATLMGTISYEILTRLGPRLPRVYL